MEYTFYDFLKLIGSLGLFLYGMKIMSEGLQKAAGNKLRTILSSMTKNRFMGVLTGLFITALIQSSSATTVMVVSFVNAGLLNLMQSITVIMGANIGTTVTAWIISFFGFQFSIASICLPLMAISIPLIFSSKNKRKSIGEFIIGFAFLFWGLDLLKLYMPDLQSNPEMLEFLAKYTDAGFGSVLLFLAVGSVLTVIVQSSSATIAITLIMCSKGWISFELGAAMVLGENIGTTITANLAAIPANISAKRAALAHLTFNVFGVIWILFLFYPFINMITHFVKSIGPGDPMQLTSFINSLDAKTIEAISDSSSNLTPEQLALSKQMMGLQLSTSYGLSLFHTIFNLINTFIMIWFVKIIGKIVSFVIKKKDTDEEFQLKYISSGRLPSTSELSLLQARQEINVYAERTIRMFGQVRELFHEKNENEFTKRYTRIEKYEKISDRMEVEIAEYLTKVAGGKLSDESKLELQTLLRVVSEIESIGDGCYNIARTILRKNNDTAVYTKEMNDNVDLMFALVEKSINQMIKSFTDHTITDEEMIISLNIENEINNFRNQLKLQNVNDVKEKKYDYPASVTYMDIIVECEKTGDYVINVAEALNELVEKR